MINTNNIQQYLLKKRIIRKNEEYNIKEIDGGTINRIFRIKTKTRTFILKQFMDKPIIGENVIMPPNRYYYEKKAIQYLDQTLKEKITPVVIFFDDRNKAICMIDLGEENRADNLIRKNKARPESFKKIGKALAEMHTKSLYNQKIKNTFDNHAFQDLRMHYRFYKYKELNDPSLKKVKDELIQKTLKNNITFLHDDLKTNNLFIIKDRFYLIDYEGVYYGDPAMEMGYFLGQLFTYYFNQPILRNKEIIISLWKSYIRNLRFNFKEKLEHNIVKQIGFTIIYKLVGIAKQEFDFVDKKTRNQIIKIAKKIILNKNIQKVDQIFEVN